VSRPPRLRRGTPETLGFGNGFAEIPQAAVAKRRLGKIILVNVDADSLGRFRFHLADCFLKRQTFPRYVGFVQSRLNATQLGNQRGTRTVIKRAAVLARVFIKTANGAVD
jgi:hypothetical protein